MDKRWDVLGFGAIAVDDVLFVERYPRIDEKVPVLKKQRHGGGNTATALVAVSRLGSSAAYCGVLGDDELSAYSIKALVLEGVDVSPIFHRPEARPFTATVIVDTTSNKRSILFSGEGVIQPDPQDITEDLISQSRVLFVDHQAISIGLHAARIAKKNHIPVIGDFEGAIYPNLLEVISLTDHLIIGDDFASRITGKEDIQDQVRVLANHERACCIVTAGENGCWFSEWGGKIGHFPAFEVEVIDTTGCGDVFHGGYAAAISGGASVLRAIQIGTAAAGLKATQPGGRDGIPTMAVVIQFLKKNGYDLGDEQQ